MSKAGSVLTTNVMCFIYIEKLDLIPLYCFQKHGAARVEVIKYMPTYIYIYVYSS